MAIKGAQAKEQVVQELLKFFGDKAFKYDKEIRVNWQEDGQLVQIKIALTAAKVAVTEGGDTAMPGDNMVADNIPAAISFNAADSGNIAQPSEQEKHNVSELLKSLGL